MSLFSYSVLAVFISYIVYTAFSIWQLMTVPACMPQDTCLQPYLATKDPNLQVYVYTSIFQQPSSDDDMSLVYHTPRFEYDKSEDSEEVVNLNLPLSVYRNNRTMYLHMFLMPGDKKIKSWQDLAKSNSVAYSGTDLVVHHKPEAAAFTLLNQNTSNSKVAGGHVRRDTKSGANNKATVHLRSVVTFSIMTDLRSLPQAKLPPDLMQKLRIISRTRYVPLLHVQRLSQRLDQLVEVSGVRRTNITLRYRQTGLPKLRLWMQFEAALESLAGLGFTAKDTDEVKGIFDTNLYLLAITFTVALLHLLFDVLAFKNDISFWRGRNSMAGLSSRTLLWRAVAQVIIFLHLLEENTSMLVLVPVGVAVFIEAWKVSKAYGYFGRGSTTVTLVSKKQEEETRALDFEAFHYLSYLLYPLCAAGAVYSLLYVPHKSWYSWLISSLVSGVYALGFLFMLPQLFINYRLKSVAHLPWRAFMYKAFNTFIDDLFAFIITMPTSHRLACFRDDIIFVIYLYQRWLYPVDAGRVNEYGTSGTQIAAAAKTDKKKKQ